MLSYYMGVYAAVPAFARTRSLLKAVAYLDGAVRTVENVYEVSGAGLNFVDYMLCDWSLSPPDTCDESSSINTVYPTKSRNF